MRVYPKPVLADAQSNSSTDPATRSRNCRATIFLWGYDPSREMGPTLNRSLNDLLKLIEWRIFLNHSNIKKKVQIVISERYIFGNRKSFPFSMFGKKAKCLAFSELNFSLCTKCYFGLNAYKIKNYLFKGLSITQSKQNHSL